MNAIRSICATLAAALLAGCAMGVTTPGNLQSRVQHGDDIYVSRLNEQLLPDGALKVGVSGGSNVNYPQTLRYRARWYDQADLPIRTSVDNWETLDVGPEGAFEFTIVAPGPRAKRYVLEFRTPDE